MCIDDYLAQRIRFVCWFCWISCDILQQLQHGRDSIWMNTILRFLQTDYTGGFRIELQYRERQETKGPVRKRPCGKFRAVLPGHHKRQQFPLLVSVNADFSYGSDQ